LHIKRGRQKERGKKKRKKGMAAFKRRFPSAAQKKGKRRAGMFARQKVVLEQRRERETPDPDRGPFRRRVVGLERKKRRTASAKGLEKEKREEEKKKRERSPAD